MHPPKLSAPVCHAAITLICSLLFVGGASAQVLIPGYPPLVTAYDPREVAKLPRYCIYTQDFRDKVAGGNDVQQIEYWYAVMGDTFHAMHHYCWGLMKTNRALLLAQSQQAREFYLGDSILEFDYVLNHAGPSFVLLPEILSRKGQNLMRLGRGQLAILELERAIEIKPDYWPPYAYLSDYHKELGDFGKARELLETALSHSPDAEGLKMRLSELRKIDNKRKPPPR